MLHDETVETTPMEYGPVDGSPGSYYLTVASGLFDAADDVDVYSFNVPVDVICDSMTMQSCVTLATAGEQRTTANIELFPPGATGNGSTVATGKVWITTAAAPAVKLAEVDGTTTDPAFGLTLQSPVTFGTEYLLHVQAPVGADVGSNPFYFLIHYGSGSNPLEQEISSAMATNNTAGVAEPLEAFPTTGGGTGYFVAGTLWDDNDVDWYSFDNVAASGDVLRATCSAQRSGSGLRGLRLTVTNAAGETLSGGQASAETGAVGGESSLGEDGIAVPASDTTLKLKIEATSASDPNIVGKYYQCGVSFGPAQ
jgi:hypothetical protein